MTAMTLSLPAGQTSAAFLVSAGERVTTTGTGKIQYTLAGIVDINNGLAAWIDWPSGTTAAFDDAEMAMYCRGVATTAMTIRVGDADTALDGVVARDGIYWKGQGITAAQTAALAVLGLVAGDAAAATTNTAAIQAALSATSNAQILTPGIFYINDPLQIDSGDKLVLSKQTEIRLTGGVRKNLIVTRAYADAKAGNWTACTLTWTAGPLCSVAKTAHGKVAGDYVLMYSTTLAPSNFNGVFVVTSVTDANNFVIGLHRVPTASPTGTAQYIAATVSAEIVGGIWNQDQANNTGGTQQEQHTIMLGGVAHLRVHDVTIKSSAKYCIEVAGAYDFVVDGIAAESVGSDVIKVYGPAVGGRIAQVSGYAGDDVVSLQTKEAATYIANAWVWGDIQNVTVENIDAGTSVAGLATLYYSADEYAGGIFFKNVGGQANNKAILIAGAYTNGVCDDVTVECPTGSGTYGVAWEDYDGATNLAINKLVVRNYIFQPDTFASNRSGLNSTDKVTVRLLALENLVVNQGSWPVSSYYIANLVSPIKVLNILGGSLKGAGSNAGFLQLANVEQVNMVGTYIDANWGKVFAPYGGAPTFNIQGCDLNCFGAVVGVSGTVTAASVVLTGNRINVGGNGVIRTDIAVPVKVYDNGNNYIGGSLFTNGSATGLWQFFGFNARIDVGATGVQKTVAGQYVFNTGSGRGTLVQNRLVTCNGTNWIQVDTPANLF